MGADRLRARRRGAGWQGRRQPSRGGALRCRGSCCPPLPRRLAPPRLCGWQRTCPILPAGTACSTTSRLSAMPCSTLTGWVWIPSPTRNRLRFLFHDCDAGTAMGTRNVAAVQSRAGRLSALAGCPASGHLAGRHRARRRPNLPARVAAPGGTPAPWHRANSDRCRSLPTRLTACNARRYPYRRARRRRLKVRDGKRDLGHEQLRNAAPRSRG